MLMAPPLSPPDRLAEAEQTIAAGRYRRAGDLLRAAADSENRVAALRKIGGYFAHLGQPASAESCFRRALLIAPSDTGALYDLASACIGLGKIDEAEALFDRVIAAAPTDWDAWANRSTLRRATPEANHIAELKATLAQHGQTSDARIALGYALAKEQEDLGKYDAALTALSEAARSRKAQLSYRVTDDVETMKQLADAFSVENLATAPQARTEPGPVFILGMPRSGSTLVDRILSSHPEIESAGEVQDFALSMMEHVKGAKSKAELIALSAQADAAAIGETYLRRMAERGHDGFAIDKTPLNFLYIGLIAKALPNARIVHVRRGAMDNGYAMYKTLFRMGYPFSYDLADIGHYMVAAERLMLHWHTALPGRIIRIDYERLIADQEFESRKLLAAIGLDWNPDCLKFHANASPVTTASAVQVREPIHDRSVGLWRRYEPQLQPLARILKQNDIALAYGA